MNARLIDLNDYIHAGEGGCGESLNHKTDSSLMIKMYDSGKPEEAVAYELELAGKVYSLGLPTPPPGELVTDQKGRFGISFKRIVNKISIARAVADHPENIDELAKEFARMCKLLHGTKIAPGSFPEVKQNCYDMIDADPYYTAQDKAKIKDFVSKAPDTGTALHGDLQFGNVIIADGQSYFIDLSDFAYGCPDFDLGMVALCCVFDHSDFIHDAFHMEPALAYEFWKAFVKHYYGPDADIKEIENHLRPYAGLKSILIETSCNCEFRHFHYLFDDIIK